VLVVRQPYPQSQGMIVQPFNGLAQLQVHGRAYGLDRRTGKIVWSTEIEKQALRLDQPSDVPVLTFFNFIQQLEGQQYRAYCSMLCLDTRNGRVLYSKESKDNRPNLFDVQADPEKSQVEIRSYIGNVKLTFTNDPEDPSAQKKSWPWQTGKP
jgi:hypothetical protein